MPLHIGVGIVEIVAVQQVERTADAVVPVVGKIILRQKGEIREIFRFLLGKFAHPHMVLNGVHQPEPDVLADVELEPVVPGRASEDVRDSFGKLDLEGWEPGPHIYLLQSLVPVILLRCPAQPDERREGILVGKDISERVFHAAGPERGVKLHHILLRGPAQMVFCADGRHQTVVQLIIVEQLRIIILVIP